MSSATSNWWSIGPMPTGTATALSTTSTAATAFGKGGGRYYIWASGCNAFLLTGSIADRIAGMTNPPKIVDVPAALFRKGRRYRQYIQSWLNGLPVSGEIQEDFNETVP